MGKIILLSKIFIISFFLALFAGNTFVDDGLRHIAFAVNQDLMKSWADVYPHSLFLQDYDPWFCWHFIISKLAIVIPKENLQLAINTLTLFLLLLTSVNLLNKRLSQVPKEINLLIAIIIASVSVRYLNGRPDNLSGIFLLLVLSSPRNIILQIISTIIYSISYYLFFIHTLLWSAVLFLKQRFTASITILSITFISLIIQAYYFGDSFWRTINYVLIDNQLRQGLFIGELQPLLSTIAHEYFFIFTIIIFTFLFIFKFYFKKKASSINILIFAASPLWLFYARTFELYVPIILLSIIIKLLKNKQHILKEYWQKIITIKYAKFYFSTILLFVVTLHINNVFSKRQQLIKNVEFIKADIFNNKIIVINGLRSENYAALYLNPSIHLIPSCSIGWFDEQQGKLSEQYFELMREHSLSPELLNNFLQQTKADYYWHFFNKNETKEYKKYNMELTLEKKQFAIFKIK